MPNHRANIRLLVIGGLSLVVAQPAMGIGGSSDAPSSSAQQYDPAVEYQKGVDAYQAKDFKSAITAFKRVIGVVPSQASAQYMLGVSYMAASDFKKAKKPLEQAIRYDAKLIEAQRDLGITYARLGDKAKATRQREAITAMKSACTAPCATSAQYDAALQALDAALSGPPQALAPAHPIGSPASADTVYVAAVGLINEKRYEEAIAELEGALWTTGPHPDLLTYLGFANRKLGRYEKAREWYEAALAVAPNHRGAIEYYGELKLELGDVKGARQHLARLDKLCGFGCQPADELRRWLREADRSAS